LTCRYTADIRENAEERTADVHDADAGSANTPETARNVYERRQQVLSEGCRHFSDTVNKSTRAWYEMYYDDQIDYVYCLISKVSCTSWKATLMMLTGKLSKFQRPEQLTVGIIHDHKNSDKYIERLEKVLPVFRNWRFTESRYFTFMFVREPLERLVSAYRDKLNEDDSYHHVNIAIVRQYRPQDYSPLIKRYNVTFPEFVRFVLDQRATGQVLDRHWIPQYELCRVCQLRWDFIGHYETLREDADCVVSRLKSRIMDVEHRQRVANITFPADSGHAKSSDFLQRMYASVPAADVQALYKLYEVDYALFGFKQPNVTGFS